MTDRTVASGSDEDQKAQYLCTARAVRECAERALTRALAGELEHFAVDESRIPSIAERVARVTRTAYPDPRKIPYHSRWRHFSAGGVDREAELDARLEAFTVEERLLSKLDLVVTSVLLDAGAGPDWSYAEGGRRYTRSEGLAVASFRLFTGGHLSSDPGGMPLRADARRLSTLTAAELGRGMQASPNNPLVGLEGRAALLRRLGDVLSAAPDTFGREPRAGSFVSHILSRAESGRVLAGDVLEVVLEALGEIWPGRLRVGTRNLGDVWTHPTLGRVPLHKLSQWLTYSLCEPLEAHGITVDRLNELTGLAEYRNGGLFVDSGALVPKHTGVLIATHSIGSPVVVEWRTLTVALLDRTASEVRRLLGMDDRELPLAKVLEGGTWSAGRELAAERRGDGRPPIRVDSDGTVF